MSLQMMMCTVKKCSFQRGLFHLRMGLEILKSEPENTFERRIVEGSQNSVKELEEWVETVTKTLK